MTERKCTRGGRGKGGDGCATGAIHRPPNGCDAPPHGMGRDGWAAGAIHRPQTVVMHRRTEPGATIAPQRVGGEGWRNIVSSAEAGSRFSGDVENNHSPSNGYD